MKIKFFSTSVLLGAAIMLQAQAPAPEAVYEIKSGIITTEMDMMGQKIVQKQSDRLASMGKISKEQLALITIDDLNIQ